MLLIVFGGIKAEHNQLTNGGLTICAIAIAMGASVTVSMLALTIGTAI